MSASPVPGGDDASRARSDAASPRTPATRGASGPGLDAASPAAAGDAVALAAVRDAAGVPVTDRSRCQWCGNALPARWPGFYCSKRCRQSAFRLRKRRVADAAGPEEFRPMRVVYADPPYIGLAKRHYGDQPTYAGEVDHHQLIAQLEDRRARGEVAGWALSCSTKSLPTIFRMLKQDGSPLVPEEARVATWVKPGGVPSETYGVHAKTEKVIVIPGRLAKPGVRDWLMAHPARGGGDLPGRKPIAFCAWLFDLLGMVPGDDLEDMFPGTGIVGRAWWMLSTQPREPVTPGRRALFAGGSAIASEELGVAEDVGGDAGLLAGGDDASLEASGDGVSLLEDETARRPELASDAGSGPADDAVGRRSDIPRDAGASLLEAARRVGGGAGGS